MDKQFYWTCLLTQIGMNSYEVKILSWKYYIYKNGNIYT